MQHQGVVQLFGQPFRARRVAFDDFDVEFVFQPLGEPVADVAAAGNDKAVVGLFVVEQHIHHRGHGLRFHGKADFVAFLNYGVGLRHNQAVAAVDGADLAVGIFGQQGDQRFNGFADDTVACFCLRHHQPHFVVGKGQHLQRAHIVEQADQVFRHQMFGVDGVGDGEGVQAVGKRFVGIEAFAFVLAVFQIID